MMFRKLKASEIDCRIQTVKNNGVSILLYKDARVDQTILDETVGPMNWQRKHTRDNRNCIVSIWDEDKKQWVEKEDTGTESNTEAEKGLASDSFKRACFNWGIGRELYSAPFIWINGADKYDKFSVKKIGYDEEGNISELVIINQKNRKVVYSMGSAEKVEKEEPVRDTNKDRISEAHVNTLVNLIRQAGVNEQKLLEQKKVQRWDELTYDVYFPLLKLLQTAVKGKAAVNENKGKN